ncbi:uracil-DNA glycosylase [Jeotgalibacillus haloalkalitolerans]|uniref:Uracil-DNA glycosylase n=1 Tax=Jeotgalibacillus haloalkalitolerans TaxID=3104292 RepID=A0ABU5KIT1_9BACL|nr:uracil-DNA glycosylase [Jeotgalibacillus sp. HH7-29]MDZ5711155.1 uracil-DNA glycosylase [Jeotgalibacillus sp. HH7-29]
MGVNIQNDWQDKLQPVFDEPEYQQLREFLKQEYSSGKVFPPMDDIYAAFKRTPFHKVKAVILGQDPYHGEGQAHGLSFSVQEGTRIPPSLQNIFKELKEDVDVDPPKSGDLTKWADEGVLLLNTVLTVKEGQAHSHKGKGWEQLTDEAIRLLGEREEPLVFILWGKPAQAKSRLIDTDKHLILNSPHPSPLAAHRGFFGSQPFSKTNKYLKEHGIDPINWSLD